MSALAVAAAIGACSDDSVTRSTTSPSPSAADLDRQSSTAGPTPTTARTDKEDAVRIRITIGDQRLTATLDDSAAARDLVAQLPATIDMIDHGGVEKTGPLPAPLSLAGQPEGADPDVGDLGYYAPGHDLVLYYGDQAYFTGIVVLGRLDGDAATQIAKLDGPVTATVQAE